MKRFFKYIPYVLSIILRIPSFFEPHWYTDTGIYSAIAEALNHNRVLYKTIIDNKPPLIYYIFSFLEKIPLSLTFEYQFLSLLFLLLSEYFLYKIVENKFNFKIAIIANLFLAFFVGSTIFEGNVANTENFYILFSILSIYFVFKHYKKKSLWNLYIAGIILGIGTLFKIPVFFDGLSIIVYFFFIYNFKEFFTKSLIYGLGSITPLSLFFVYEYFRGMFFNSFYYIFLSNFKYVNTYSSNITFGIPHILFNLYIIIILFILLYILYRNKIIKSNTLFFILWFLLDLFSVFLSGRPYLHYLIQLSVSLSVIFSLLIYLFIKSNLKIKIIIIVIPILSIYFLGIYFFRSELSWQVSSQFQSEYAYYPNFISFILKEESRKQYFSTFAYNTNVVFEKHSSTANINYAISSSLNKLNVKNRNIFIMGNFPWVYYMTNSVPAVQYSADFMMHTNDHSRIMKSLEKHKPYIILYYNDGFTFNRLFLYIKKFYKLYETVDGAYIYIRD